MFKTIGLCLALPLAFLIASCGAGNSSARQDATGTTSGTTTVTTTGTTPATTTSTHLVTMPENTAIAVTLVDSIDTDVQITGATFRAKLSEPIVIEGHTLFADGSAAKGVLSKVVESGRLKTPAEMNFSLTAIQDETGRWIDVGTNTIVEKKASHTNREIAMVGGGAIIGGIIGKVIDKKGSTEIGAAAGAAAGVGAAAATGKQDIFHGVGTEIVFFSSQSMQIAMSNSVPRKVVTGTSPATTAVTTSSTRLVTMPESTAIAVTLVDSIDTDVQVTGATFRAKLSESIVVDGRTLFANGAAAKGVLSKVVESGRLKTPAEMHFSLTAIQDETGRWIDVGTNTIVEKKASHTNREIAMIGGGAIIGGIIGKVIDKKGSTEIGAATGAAAGVGAAAATGKQDIFHGVGTEIVFFSSQSMQIAVDNSSGRRIVTRTTPTTSHVTSMVTTPTTTTSTTTVTTTSTRFVTMPESTAIAIMLVDSIDTDVQVTGATFRAKLSESVVVGGHTLFANGAAAKGVLSKVVESGRLKTPAELSFSLTAIQDGNGNWIDVGTNTIVEKKASHTNREIAMIGGGAIIGGIIGKVIDKKGSTEIGAATGAAAGVGAAAATGKQDIFHGVGTAIVFFSSQSMQIAME